ncbi:retinol dehydrogenase 12-like [Homarus americanus]|uniref:retinol dehydrogenase 12-like n=1 Tax=Homarus americanus TaxID=6706 RepID=UPI001C45266B|nr:retinol dehydrogenase 12-like [Homarus americanus]
MGRVDAFLSCFSPHWVSTAYFTQGMAFFFKQELHILSLLWFTMYFVDILTDHSLSCMLTHTAIILLVRRALAGGICTSTRRLDGHVVVITGCNIGIGLETARDLSNRGAKIIMACRNTKEAEKKATEIRGQTGGQLEVMKLDLASLTSVREFAADLKTKETRIHMLINNAGVMMCPQMKTEDGFDMQMGTNHFGHFLLTCLLLPLLTHSEPARIINISSLAHAMGIIPFDDWDYKKGYDRVQAYANSKLANVLFTRQLAQKVKETNIQVFAVHPGAVQSNLGRHIIGNLSATDLYAIIGKNTVEGIQTTLHCALEANQEEPYYYSDCGLGYASAAARDDEAAESLWLYSQKVVGLKNDH